MADRPTGRLVDRVNEKRVTIHQSMRRCLGQAGKLLHPFVVEINSLRTNTNRRSQTTLGVHRLHIGTSSRQIASQFLRVTAAVVTLLNLLALHNETQAHAVVVVTSSSSAAIVPVGRRYSI